MSGKSGANGFFEDNPMAWVGVALLGLVALAALLVSNGTIKPAKKIAVAKSAKLVKTAGHAIVTPAHASSVPPAVVKMGERVFKENCEVCHQADAIGKPGVAPSLINPEFLSLASDKFLMSTIRDGREDTGMPPWAHLGRTKIRAVVEYLRSHQTVPDRSAQVNNEADSHGDPRLGQQWYENICSTCHGVAGDGYAAGGTGTAIGLKGFLNKVTDGFIRETVKYGRSNTRMRGFKGPTAIANLSDQEIDDIIVYLRSHAK